MLRPLLFLSAGIVTPQVIGMFFGQPFSLKNLLVAYAIAFSLFLTVVAFAMRFKKPESRHRTLEVSLTETGGRFEN